MRFGVVIATGVDAPRFTDIAADFAARVQPDLRALAEPVRRNLAAFDAYFAAHGKTSPLPGQIARAAERGFGSPGPAPILALLALEAATGVLMGVQNADAISEYAELDVLAEPDSFPGLSGKAVHCRAGDVVVRDATGIIASVFDGPDKRTAVTGSCANLAIYVFDAYPSLGAEHTRACAAVVSLLTACAADVMLLEAS